MCSEFYPRPLHKGKNCNLCVCVCVCPLEKFCAPEADICEYISSLNEKCHILFYSLPIFTECILKFIMLVSIVFCF